MKLNNASKTPVKSDKDFDKIDEAEKFDKFDLANSCSATDCTGLIQGTAPLDDKELESYHEVYDFGPPDMSK